MQKRKKHGYTECLKYMQMIKEGTSIHAIHMKYGINEDRLHVLWNRYQSDGRSGLFKRKNIRADFALKKEIVLDIEEKCPLGRRGRRRGAAPAHQRGATAAREVTSGRKADRRRREPARKNAPHGERDNGDYRQR